MPTYKGQKYNPFREDGNRKKLSKTFMTADELMAMEKTENIMKECPDEILSKDIKLNPRDYVHLKKQIGKNKSRKKETWFSENHRIQAATVYAMVGSAARTEEITGIPQGTIRQWKTKEWWPQIIDRIRNECDDELDTKLTGVIDKAVDSINDRLDKGDWIYDARTGEINRKPVSGRDAAYMTATMIDKRALIRKKRDKKSEEATITDRLKKLANEFERFVKAKDVTPEITKEALENAVRIEETPGRNASGQEVVTV